MNNKARNNKPNKLKKLYEKPIDKLTFDELIFFAQALDENHLKMNVEDFFERNPKFAASFIKKYREHVRKVCPDANTNKAINKNNLMGANVNNTFENFIEGNDPNNIERTPPEVVNKSGGKRKKYKKKSKKKLKVQLKK